MLSLKMIITVDTNVIYQALRNRNGASNFIFRLIRNSELTLALSIPVYTEYRDVLLRQATLEDLNLLQKDIKAVLRFLAYIGKPVEISFLMRPNLKDEADNMFIELAFASNSRYLITNNVKDFTVQNNLKFDGFTIITPAEFVKKWRENHEQE